MADQLLPPVLHPAVQAQLPARRREGPARQPQPPYRLENAQRGQLHDVDGRDRVFITFSRFRGAFDEKERQMVSLGD